MTSRTHTELVLGDRTLYEEWKDELEAAAQEGTSRGGTRVIDAGRVWFKWSSLSGRVALRHGLRFVFLRIAPPRVAEFQNLAWLRRHEFHAPQPLIGGAFFSRGLPRFQFLVTRHVPDAHPLHERFRERPQAQRMAIVKKLATEVARLHQARFVHRDLFPRNLLVETSPEGVRIHFLDAWRGGRRRGTRGPHYDLACLLLEGAVLFTAEEERAFFRAYFEQRSTLDPVETLKRVVVERRALVRRLERKFKEDSVPAPDWIPR